MKTRGMMSTEFLISVASLLGIWSATLSGSVDAAQAIDYTRWIVGIYAVSRTGVKIAQRGDDRA